MTLIACPECMQRVSDQAAACPRCGCPIASPPPPPDPEQVAEPTTAGPGVKPWAVLLLPLAFLLAFSIFQVSGSSKEERPVLIEGSSDGTWYQFDCERDITGQPFVVQELPLDTTDSTMTSGYDFDAVDYRKVCSEEVKARDSQVNRRNWVALGLFGGFVGSSIWAWRRFKTPPAS